MSLFKITQLKNSEIDAAVQIKGSAVDQELKLSFVNAAKKRQISEIFPTLLAGKSIFYHTEGAWSNIDLLEHILNQTGPAKLYLTTWSIGEIEIRRLVAWQESSLITKLTALMDNGIRNRKPEIYQQITNNFKNLKFVKCHAKISVIVNDDYFITIMGSANFTKNPRIETGIVIFNKEIAEQNINWIIKIMQDDKRGNLK